MGQFSWITSDTGEQVFCDDPKEVYYLLIPEEFQDVFGRKYFKENDYKGYGVFGGKDAYALVAQMNCDEKLTKNQDGSWKNDEEIRGYGIDIACYDEDNENLKYPIKITAYPLKYEDVEASKSDPNQGWHTNDALECDYCGNYYDDIDFYEGDECPDCKEGTLYYT